MSFLSASSLKSSTALQPLRDWIRAELARRALERAKEHADEVRAECQTLVGFIKNAWHIIEPENEYVHGWHIEVIAEHLEAITNGTFLAMGLENRLQVNVPPGMMKSLLSTVFWPAWEWGPKGKKHLRYIATSYAERLTKRDSRRFTKLVTSEWFQTLWPMEIVREQEAEIENSSGGYRLARPFGSLTGERGDRLLIDDPHSTETAESEAELESTTRRFREGATTRLTDPKRSAILVMMQRLNQKDVSGVIEELSLPYIKLVLPMEFEKERMVDGKTVGGPCVTPLGIADKRTKEGELLFKARFPREVVERDKVPLGSYGVSAQFQQNPTSREGNLFKRAWFTADRIIKFSEVPAGTKWVRHWDLAASTRKSSPRTAGVKMGKTPKGRYIVAHCIVTQSEGHVVRELILNTAKQDGHVVEISLPQDPGQAGKVQGKDYIALLAGYVVRVAREQGEKYIRAEPFSSQCEGGNVDLVEGDWISAYLDELCDFPGGKWADRVDATSGAFGRLVGPKKSQGVGAPRVVQIHAG